MGVSESEVSRESAPASGPSRRKVAMVGVVDSISGPKTVRVVVNNLTRHPLYGKYVRRRTRLLVHDARGEARLGDTVELTQSRPISKNKSWRLVRVVRSGGSRQAAGGSLKTPEDRQAAGPAPDTATEK